MFFLLFFLSNLTLFLLNILATAIPDSGAYEFCVEGYENKINNQESHLLANVDVDNFPTVRWKVSDPFHSTMKVNFSSIGKNLTLNVVVETLHELDMIEILDIQATFYTPVDYSQCYCSSSDVVGDENNPSYWSLQNNCSWNDNKESYPDLHYCPLCSDNQCKKAKRNRRKNNASDPIYKNWLFYTKVDGQITGPGLSFFRQEIVRSFGEYGLTYDRTNKKCVLDIQNQPLPQFYCSDYANVFNGHGHGVNTKNQRCGFSMWINCLEDIEKLGGNDTETHTANINLDLVPCPKIDPITTIPPTSYPTNSFLNEPYLQPTNSPTYQPTTIPSSST